MKLIAIHNRILKERINEAVHDIRLHAPEIERSVQISGFIQSVNAMTFKERMMIVWRILWRKL